MKRITIKDVAALAGVSPSTVSFVLNNTESQSISKITSQKVMDAAKTLCYRPNYMASNMRNNKSKTIGVVISYNVYHLFFADMIAGILSVAESLGYGVLICETDRENFKNGSYIRYFLENRIDGVLFLSSAHSENSAKELEYIQEFKEHHIPFITIYGYTNLIGHCYVNIDFYQCGKEACTCLISRGAKKILYIAPLDRSGEQKYTPKTERDKQLGCSDAIKELDFTFDLNVLYLPRNFKESGYKKIIALLDKEISHNGYDGFITCWATYGIQMLNALSNLSISVPKQAKLIAMDTLPYLDHTIPSLSSMQLPFFEIAQKGTEILIKSYLMGNTDKFCPSVYELPCKLVERESTMSQANILNCVDSRDH